MIKLCFAAAVAIALAFPARADFSQEYYNSCIRDSGLIAKRRAEISGWRALKKSGLPLITGNPATDRAAAAMDAQARAAEESARNHAHWGCMIEARRSHEMRMYLWESRDQEYDAITNLYRRIIDGSSPLIFY
jgi:hypothetical protein